MSTHMDRAPDTVTEAANEVASRVGRLWQLAFVSGVREGMELSARGMQAAIDSIPEADFRPDFEMVLREVLGTLRDRLRTEALGIEDPPPVIFDSEDS